MVGWKVGRWVRGTRYKAKVEVGGEEFEGEGRKQRLGRARQEAFVLNLLERHLLGPQLWPTLLPRASARAGLRCEIPHWLSGASRPSTSQRLLLQRMAPPQCASERSWVDAETVGRRS